VNRGVPAGTSPSRRTERSDLQLGAHTDLHTHATSTTSVLRLDVRVLPAQLVGRTSRSWPTCTRCLGAASARHLALSRSMPKVGLEPTRPCGQRILSPPHLTVGETMFPPRGPFLGLPAQIAACGPPGRQSRPPAATGPAGPRKDVQPARDRCLASARHLLFLEEPGTRCTVMPKVGLEPTRPCGQRILSPPRLPVPPLRPADVMVDGLARLI
jgi:hypothetical protein